MKPFEYTNNEVMFMKTTELTVNFKYRLVKLIPYEAANLIW